MGIAAIIWTLGESIWFLPFPFLCCKGLLSLELLLKYSSLKIPRGGTWQFHKIMSTLSEPWISLSQETDNFRAHLWGPHGDVLYNTSWREGSRKEVYKREQIPPVYIHHISILHQDPMHIRVARCRRLWKSTWVQASFPPFSSTFSTLNAFGIWFGKDSPWKWCDRNNSTSEMDVAP